MADPGQGAGEAGGKPDFNTPEFQAHIASVRQQERAAAEAEKQRIIANRDEILKEKKAFEAFGKPEDLARKLEEFESLRSKIAATDAGVDPEKFKSAVEAAATAKYRAREDEFSTTLKSAETKAAKFEAELAAERSRADDLLLTQHVILASANGAQVHPGGMPFLIAALKERAVKVVSEDGKSTSYRFKAGDGTWIPGTAGKDHMDLAEAMGLARLGKGPIGDLSLFFVSNGSGSGTQAPAGQAGSKTITRADLEKLEPAEQRRVLLEEKRQVTD